jgi:hypothetical protein
MAHQRDVMGTNGPVLSSDSERWMPATPAARWALGVLIVQGLSVLAFLAIAQATHRGVLLAVAYYVVIGSGIVAVIAGIVVSMKQRRPAWLLVSVAAIATYVGVAIYAFACCARWGS